MLMSDVRNAMCTEVNNRQVHVIGEFEHVIEGDVLDA